MLKADSFSDKTLIHSGFDCFKTGKALSSGAYCVLAVAAQHCRISICVIGE